MEHFSSESSVITESCGLSTYLDNFYASSHEKAPPENRKGITMNKAELNQQKEWSEESLLDRTDRISRTGSS
ncbi:MAG TPA: hypothetical protein VK563_02260 [Puia sp.]|nr:hypothetical protein [Puia sp.]